MSFVVGLTGGIGSGKTAASDHFRRLGVTVVDADLVAREVVAPGSAALNAIFAHFGEQLRLPDGSLDRRALRELVFHDSSQRQWLEALLHPLIEAGIREQLAATRSGYQILVSPLLLEGKQRQLVDRVLLIDAPESLQLSRSSARDGSSRETVSAIIRAQMPRQQRLRLADDIIVNDADLARLQAQVEQLHQNYCSLAASAVTKGQI